MAASAETSTRVCRGKRKTFGCRAGACYTSRTYGNRLEVCADAGGKRGIERPPAARSQRQPVQGGGGPGDAGRAEKALFALIDHHDETLAGYVTDGKLSLESYKEYVELFARSLRETMDNREGVHYLLRAAGLETIAAEDVNLSPEWRWR